MQQSPEMNAAGGARLVLQQPVKYLQGSTVTMVT